MSDSPLSSLMRGFICFDLGTTIVLEEHIFLIWISTTLKNMKMILPSILLMHIMLAM